MGETWHAVTSRRNVRAYTADEIAPEQLDRILEAARRTLSDEEVRSICASAPVPPPSPVSPLVGRCAERDAITALFLQDSWRLSTIVGVAGAGKTRLAIEVATLLHTREHLPVYWIELGWQHEQREDS